MRSIVVTVLLAGAVALLVGSAAASDKADVMAVVNRFNDSMNKGDTKMAFATCASPTAIIDEFPPYGWQSTTACADWANAFDAFNKQQGIADPFATLAKPRHVDVTGDRAYVVVPATYTFKEHGKKTVESGSTLTGALQKTAGGWMITAWAWSKH